MRRVHLSRYRLREAPGGGLLCRVGDMPEISCLPENARIPEPGW